MIDINYVRRESNRVIFRVKLPTDEESVFEGDITQFRELYNSNGLARRFRTENVSYIARNLKEYRELGEIADQIEKLTKARKRR